MKQGTGKRKWDKINEPGWMCECALYFKFNDKQDESVVCYVYLWEFVKYTKICLQPP